MADTDQDIRRRSASRAASLIRDYYKHPTRRTEILRMLAVEVVNLRSSFTLTDGRVDWSGRSSEYRDLIADVYARGGVPAEDLDKFQAALRYHVGNRLREVADADELADSGLHHASPRTRLHASRDIVTAVDTLRDFIVHSPNMATDLADHDTDIALLVLAERILKQFKMGERDELERGIARTIIRRCARRCVDLL